MSLKRNKPLRSDPAKTAAWQRESRARTRLSRVSALGRAAPKRRQRVPAGARAEALARSEGWCCQCLYRVGYVPGEFPSAKAGAVLVSKGMLRRARQVHHVLAVQRWPQLELEPDNMVGLCRQCHMDHEFAPDKRMDRLALPPEPLQLALRLGAKAVYDIERYYPHG